MSDNADTDPNGGPKHVDADEYSASPPSDNPSGATIVTAYAKRRLRAYSILDSEVKNLSMFNTLSAVCFSVMSAFISFAVGIWVNSLFVENPPAEGKILSHVAAPASCVFAVIAFCLGIWAIWTRTSTWRDIRRESSGQG
jgi:hypothetical protein